MASQNINDNFNTQVTHDELVANASKAGKASVEAKRKRKQFKEELLLLLEENNNNKKVSVALLNKALNGDIQAFTTIRDTIGEKPTDKVDLSSSEPFEVKISIVK